MLAIINADDLGVNTGCNDTIFDLMRLGRITSATILANCAGTEDALQRARDFPQCSFGVHLNATVEQPLRKDARLAPILDAAGCFRKDLYRQRLGSATREALYLEFCAQVDRILASGIPVSHLDSHHHVHNLPQVFSILKAVQRRFGIRKVRISQNLYPPAHRVSLPLSLKKLAFNYALRHYYATKTTDGFTDLLTFYQLSQARRLSLRTVEIMVHPGPRKYAEETALLKSPWFERLPVEIRSINYHSL